MAREDAVVVLTGVLDEIHKATGRITNAAYQAVSFKMDVAKPTEVNGVVHKVLKSCRIDVLVNNAGVSGLSYLVDMHDELRDKIININIEEVFIATKAVLPSMMERKYGRS